MLWNITGESAEDDINGTCTSGTSGDYRIHLKIELEKEITE